jgi:hypothetical protein
MPWIVLMGFSHCTIVNQDNPSCSVGNDDGTRTIRRVGPPSPYCVYAVSNPIRLSSLSSTQSICGVRQQSAASSPSNTDRRHITAAISFVDPTPHQAERYQLFLWVLIINHNSIRTIRGILSRIALRASTSCQLTHSSRYERTKCRGLLRGVHREKPRRGCAGAKSMIPDRPMYESAKTGHQRRL